MKAEDDEEEEGEEEEECVIHNEATKCQGTVIDPARSNIVFVYLPPSLLHARDN